ncbi:MAG: EAL domain-containing protein (putative c-di-GMP-specific phosphodiesterase class I), partial [Ilumatobacter sp.]
GQLRPVFQPLFDMRPDEALGAEALLPWHHTEHGEILAVSSSRLLNCRV